MKILPVSRVQHVGDCLSGAQVQVVRVPADRSQEFHQVLAKGDSADEK